MMELLTGVKHAYVEEHQRGIRVGGHGALASLDDLVSDRPSSRTMEESSCKEKKDLCTATDPRPHFLLNNIKVEAISYDGRNFTDANTCTSTDDTKHHLSSTPVKEEPVSCEEEDITHPQLHPAIHPPSLIKEEPVLRQGGNLTDLHMYIPTDPTQQYASPIKEEPVTCEGGSSPDIYTPIDHIDYYSPSSMEEPFSQGDGKLTDHTQQHPFDPLTADPLCDEGRAIGPDKHTDALPSSAHPERKTDDLHDNYSLFDKGNLDTDIYALIKHAQAKYTFTRIEEGSSSEEGENPKETEPQTTADLTSQRPSPHTGEAVPQTFQCRDCSECFTRKSGLINHRRNHRQEKLTCSKCGKVFSKRSGLQNHLTLHTGEKPFACPICGKCFARKSNLISHETIHSGKASFICAECGRYFVCKVHLTKHQIIHEK
ncbi:gastrula zinc finger protein XlCGF48.2-like [Dendropsophus ebraccatus]|uniref:gastrula zinc finger protein XlCGF48.2-like n=1 Tax=Dendropsophus ebraccatus TaxID=150705 RepID=UPI00383108F0